MGSGRYGKGRGRNAAPTLASFADLNALVRPKTWKAPMGIFLRRQKRRPGGTIVVQGIGEAFRVREMAAAQNTNQAIDAEREDRAAAVPRRGRTLEIHAELASQWVGAGSENPVEIRHDQVGCVVGGIKINDVLRRQLVGSRNRSHRYPGRCTGGWLD